MGKPWQTFRTRRTYNTFANLAKTRYETRTKFYNTFQQVCNGSSWTVQPMKLLGLIRNYSSEWIIFWKSDSELSLCLLFPNYSNIGINFCLKDNLRALFCMHCSQEPYFSNNYEDGDFATHNSAANIFHLKIDLKK